jgi:hypothetical protein
MIFLLSGSLVPQRFALYQKCCFISCRTPPANYSLDALYSTGGIKISEEERHAMSSPRKMAIEASRANQLMAQPKKKTLRPKKKSPSKGVAGLRGPAHGGKNSKG